MLKKLKAWLLTQWLKVPFGRICSFEYGAQNVVVRKNLWLVISDGKSSDALPISFVSPELIGAVEARMRQLGYAAN